MNDGSHTTDSDTHRPHSAGRSRSERRSRRSTSGRWRPDGELPSGSRVGRYVILYRLGRGGMGIVYAAYDPQLDRKVAVKLLRDRDGDANAENDVSHGRMLREAQALARLSHPNVVAVHDAGLIDGRVFLAMDFVDGETLRSWLKSQPRPRHQIVDAFIQAGDALVAAHAAGIVHRDFKPDNAIFGRDGRVQVLDFGLARLREHDASEAVGVVEADGRAPPGPSAKLPHPGTPAYMAPEQHERRAVGPPADQFAFCVALWEGLCDRHPFEGKGEALLANIRQTRVLEPPRGRLSGHLRRILRRGLSADPQDRYPSMQALLTELRHDPNRRWRRVGMTSGVLLLTAGSVVTYAQLAGPPERCAGAMTRVLEVWGDERRAQLRAAIGGVDRGHAAHTRDAVEHALDRYATRWNEAHIAACEATHVRQEQSEALLDLRMGCLGEHLERFAAVTALLAAANADVADNALATVDGLPDLDRCDDVFQLRERQPLPHDPERRSQIEQTRARVARVRALHRSAQVDEALTDARAAVRQAKELDYPPLTAQAGLALGLVLELGGKAAEAREALLDAEVAAELARDDALLLDIRIQLIMVVGDRLGHTDQGRMWTRLARATLERLGGSIKQQAQIETQFALVLDHEAHPEEVLIHQRRALDLAERADLTELDLGSMHSNLAGTLAEVGRFDEAIQHAQQARLIWERALGPQHYRVAVAMSTLGFIHDSQGNPREGMKWYERGYALIRSELGPNNTHTANTRSNLAIVQANLGLLDEAERGFREVLKVRRLVDGPDHLEVARAHTNLGVVLSKQGRFDEALIEQRQALAVKERALGRDDVRIAKSLEEIANILERLDRYAESLPLRTRALDIRVSTHGPDHPSMSTTLGNLAHNHLQLGELDHALAYANRALLVSDDPSVRSDDRAYVRVVLAKILSARAEDLERARGLFEQAQLGLEDHSAPTIRRLLRELADQRGWPLALPPPPSEASLNPATDPP